MSSQHAMPFGAESRDAGRVCFRLWAPGAASVDLHLEAGSRELPMSRLDPGWYELAMEASAGAQYRFNIDQRHLVPDPASRFQPSGIDGPSQVVDPLAYEWLDSDWRGRPWHEAVIYELHVGTFSPEGTFAGVQAKLDYLAELGVTAVEFMPLGSFPGQRNWGYDGVLPYAPAHCYGRPEDLKRLIDAAHARKLMVLLDVVYNHFGPEGNYLAMYAPQFFTDRHHTPWGKAINFDGRCSPTVREFFIHNALYWLEEYHFDGLRFDAVHAIMDDSRPDILIELAESVRNRFEKERRVHLVLENDKNESRYLNRDHQRRPRWYSAQWNDDVHHALHTLVTGERDGYFSDYANDPVWHLGRCLAEGFSFQGQPSAFRHRERRGENSRDLPPEAFVAFLQNHDQIGNRALGERITRLCGREALKMAMAILLLAPSPPLLFMGEEFGAATPFLFFCDMGPELAEKVRAGRRVEFARFEEFNSLQAQARIPDPNREQTFLDSKLDWNSRAQSPHREWLRFYRQVLRCRSGRVAPLIQDIAVGKATFEVFESKAVDVEWPLLKGGNLELIANFGSKPVPLAQKSSATLLFTSSEQPEWNWKELPALTAAWFLNA
jgi:maltooligosyltrehalose trehalohydrolase